MFSCKGTEAILEEYAPELRRYLQYLKVHYVLGVVAFDQINNENLKPNDLIIEQSPSSFEKTRTERIRLWAEEAELLRRQMQSKNLVPPPPHQPLDPPKA